MAKLPSLSWDAGSTKPDEEFTSLIGLSVTERELVGGLLCQLASLYPDLVSFDAIEGERNPYHVNEDVRAAYQNIGSQIVGATAFFLNAILDPTSEESPKFYVERVGSHYTIHLELPEPADSGISAVTAHALAYGETPTADLDGSTIDFGIPAGEPGATGATGETGPAGPAGPAGSYSVRYAVDDFDEEECKCCA